MPRSGRGDSGIVFLFWHGRTKTLYNQGWGIHAQHGYGIPRYLLYCRGVMFKPVQWLAGGRLRCQIALSSDSEHGRGDTIHVPATFLASLSTFPVESQWGR